MSKKPCYYDYIGISFLLEYGTKTETYRGGGKTQKFGFRGLHSSRIQGRFQCVYENSHQYNIIPEVVYATTSITTKTSREFATPKGVFYYQSIKKSAFTGYGLRQIDRDKILIAEPEKALADYLYFVDLKRVSLNDRLKLGQIKKAELIGFARLFKRPSMLKLIEHIYAESKKPRKIY